MLERAKVKINFYCYSNNYESLVIKKLIYVNFCRLFYNG